MKRHMDIPVILVFLFVFVFGFYALFSMKLSLLPPRSEPVITIVTEYHEMEPDLVEESITRPIDGLLKEVKGIKSFFSYSSRGRSRIVVFLDEGEDVDEKSILIKDRIYHVADRFPEEVREPALYKYNTDENPVMVLSLNPREGRESADGNEDFDAFVEQKLKPELLSVEGVANVETAGARREEIFVAQRYEDLARLKGDYEAVFGEIVRGSVQVPLGAMDSGSERVTLSFPNRYTDFSLLSRFRLPATGARVLGGDVLDVRREKHAEERISFVNNAPALTLYVFKKDVSNILEIGRGVREAVSRKRAAFTCRVLYDQSEEFRALLTRLGVAASLSIVCGFVFISIFYRSAVFASLVVLALSSSFTATVSALMLLGRGMNVMSLAGIIVGIGPCMGNGLFLLDEAARTGREGADRGDNTSVAVRNALRPVAAFTIALVVLFLPLFLMSSELAAIDEDFALSVSVMSAMSALVALLLLPALIRAFGIDPLSTGLPNAKVQAVLRKLSLLSRTGMNRGPLVFVLFAGAAAGSAFFVFARGYEDAPPLKEDTFELYFEFDPEYNTGYKREALLAIGEEIKSMGMPAAIVSKLEDTRATFLLKFPSGYGQLKRDAARLKERLSRVRRDDGFFTFQAGKEAGVKSVLLYFFGDRQDRLEKAVDDAAEACSGIAGVTQVLKGYREGKTELVFTVEPSRMYSLGMNSSGVIGFLRYVFYFPVILKHYTGEKIVDVRGKVAVEGLNKENIRSLGVASAEGEYVALGDFTTLSYSKGAPVISRKDGKRFISLDLRYEKTGEDALVKTVRSRLGNTKFEGDIYYQFDERHLETRRNRVLFMVSLALALFLSYVVLGTATNSFAWPLRIILVVPSVLIGGAIFLAAGGYARSVPVHVGLVMLTALALTGPLLIVDELLRSGGGNREAPSRSLLLRACENRLRALTAVSLAPALSMTPFVILMRSNPFFAVLAGLVLSGEVTSFLLSLLVFPAVCSPAAGVEGPLKTERRRKRCHY